jgi:hypothetical protein
LGSGIRFELAGLMLLQEPARVPQLGGCPVDWREVRMNPIRTVLIALALLPTCLVAPARAENVVRWATAKPAETFDPYGHDELFTQRAGSGSIH